MTYTADSPLLATPQAIPIQAYTWLNRHGSVYDSYSIGIIVGHYFGIGAHVGLDPVLAIAQCAHETAAEQPDKRWFILSSWWAQRPRRNPAGIGVWGDPRTTEPKDKQNWAYDQEAKVWKRGLSFPTWEHAAKAHIGRLLAYALTDAQASAAQRALIKSALGDSDLPHGYRGAAAKLRGLNGRWAVPGDNYSDKIAEIANSIVAVKLPKSITNTGQ